MSKEALSCMVLRLAEAIGLGGMETGAVGMKGATTVPDAARPVCVGELGRGSGEAGPSLESRSAARRLATRWRNLAGERAGSLS